MLVKYFLSLFVFFVVINHHSAFLGPISEVILLNFSRFLQMLLGSLLETSLNHDVNQMGPSQEKAFSGTTVSTTLQLRISPWRGHDCMPFEIPKI